jgi:hypothetical protein
MFLHLRRGLIEYGLHFTPVFAVQFVELVCSMARDLLDRLPLLFGEIEFVSKTSQKHVSDHGSLSGKNPRNPVPHIHSSAYAADQDA